MSIKNQQFQRKTRKSFSQKDDQNIFESENKNPKRFSELQKNKIIPEFYNSLDKTVNLRVYLKWNDDSENGATMNNAADTSVTATETNTAKVNVNLRFIQLPSNGGTTTTTTGDVVSTTGGDTTTTG